MDDDVSIWVRLKGARAAAREARMVAGGVDHIGRSSRSASTQLGFMRAAGAGASGMLGSLGGAARRGAYGIASLSAIAGTYGVVTGVKFNATMEQNTVAFTNLLGSAGAARAKLSELYELAKLTPFEFPELVEAQLRLQGFGMGAKETTGLLRDLGDAVAGSGAGSAEIKRATYALGQMAARGKVMQEELNQLTEARIPAQRIIREELGLTKAEMNGIGREGIAASKAIPALQRGLKKLYGGQALKQSKTFNGQLSSMKDSLNQTLGTITMPGFKALRDDLFPGLNKALGEVNETFARTDLDMGEKLRRARTSIRQHLGPFAEDMLRQIEGLNLDDKLAGFVEEAAPKMADAAAQAAPKAAAAFVGAWLEMGPWGKLLTLSLFASKLGVFRTLGGMASGRFMDAMVVSTGPNLEKGKGKMKPQLSGFGRWMGRAIGLAAVASIGLALREFALQEPALAQYSGSKGWGELGRDITDWLPGEDSEQKRARERRARPTTQHEREMVTPGPAMHPPFRPLRQRGPRPSLPKLTDRFPKSRQTRGVEDLPPIQNHIFLDGRQIAEAVGKHTQNHVNRK